ncbi:MAG TPA: IPT/TIG domain-containing protein [Actinomycetota bacterium]|nr:IPT/TIG domain-containing protein [Actinomycetota bacterium]
MGVSIPRAAAVLVAIAMVGVTKLAMAAGPTVTSTTPPAAPNTGSATITIRGSGFEPGATARLQRTGQSDIVAGSVTHQSGDAVQATFNLTAQAPGAWNVRVTNPGGASGACSGCFEIAANAPTVASTSPSSGGRGAKDYVVEITGTNFARGAQAMFLGGGIEVTSTTWNSPTKVTAKIEIAATAATSARDVRVTNTDGQQGQCSGCFTVNASPDPRRVSPARAFQGAQNVQVTVRGEAADPPLRPFESDPRFREGAQVVFSGEGITVHSTSYDEGNPPLEQPSLVATISVAPGAVGGPRDLTVVNPDGGRGTCSGCFTIDPVPTVTSVAPSSRGQGASNQSVTITGTGFTPGSTASFSGSGITVHSSNRETDEKLVAVISVAQGAATTARDVSVTTSQGGRGTCVGCFTVNAAPVVTGVSPDNRTRGQSGQNVTVTGSGFVSGAAVSFSGAGITVNSTTFTNATTLVANISLAQDAAPGNRDARVTNPDGGLGTCTNCFIVNGGVTVTQLTPSAGINNGSVQVTIDGSGFADGATARLKRAGQPDIVGTSTAVESPTRMRATFNLNGKAPGKWDMRVTNTDNTTGVCTECFAIASAAPTVTGVTPSSRAQGAQGQELTLSGTNFAAGATVTFAGSGITVGSTTVESASSIKVVVDLAPDAATGARNVTVRNADEQAATCNGCFTVSAAPTVTGVTPGQRARGQSNQSLSVSGTGFVGGAQVEFSGSGITVNSTTVNGDSSLTVNISIASDAPLGARNLTVVNGNGGRATCTGCFTVSAPPAVTGLSPNQRGQGSTNQAVTLTGSGFQQGATVSFSGSGVTVSAVTVNSATSLTATVSVAPDAGTGNRNATVTNPDTGSGGCSNCFTVNAGPKPTQATPDVGIREQTLDVTLDGSGFVNGSAVSFGEGIVVNSVTFLAGSNVPETPARLRANITIGPKAGLGLRDVVVTNPDAGRGTCATCFLVEPIRGRFNPLAPARILDSRTGEGGYQTPWGPDMTRDVQVTGRGGVPASGVSAVALNVTVTDVSQAPSSWLAVFPAGDERPLASNLNYTPGLTIPNLVVVKVGQGGKVSLYNASGQANVIFDVAGWYGDTPQGNAGRLQPLTPSRLVDTRNGDGGATGPAGAGTTREVQVTGRGGVPTTGVSAVVLNVTVTDVRQAPSWLVVSPTGENMPLASNLNYAPGETRANRVVVKVGTGGKISYYNDAGSAHVIMDVNGWITDGSVTTGGPGAFSAMAPSRILDTRNGTGGIEGRIGPDETVSVPVAGRGGVPTTGVSAVVMNVTVTDQAANDSSYLTLFPTGEPRPTASDLNFVPGQTVPNLVVVKVGSGGKVDLYNASWATHVIFDVVGWYN